MRVCISVARLRGLGNFRSLFPQACACGYTLSLATRAKLSMNPFFRLWQLLKPICRYLLDKTQFLKVSKFAGRQFGVAESSSGVAELLSGSAKSYSGSAESF
jgi:hypothetical protein